MLELADTTKPKVLCSGCRTRLANLETGKLTTEKWEDDRTKIEIYLVLKSNSVVLVEQWGAKWITAAMFVRSMYRPSIIS